jgi:hypothetical protein
MEEGFERAADTFNKIIVAELTFNTLNTKKRGILYQK